MTHSALTLHRQKNGMIKIRVFSYLLSDPDRNHTVYSETLARLVNWNPALVIELAAARMAKKVREAPKKPKRFQWLLFSRTFSQGADQAKEFEALPAYQRKFSLLI